MIKNPRFLSVIQKTYTLTKAITLSSISNSHIINTRKLQVGGSCAMTRLYSTAQVQQETPQTTGEENSAGANMIAFSSRIGVKFRDFNMIQDALTHLSFQGETKERDEVVGGGRYNLLGNLF